MRPAVGRLLLGDRIVIVLPAITTLILACGLAFHHLRTTSPYMVIGLVLCSALLGVRAFLRPGMRAGAIPLALVSFADAAVIGLGLAGMIEVTLVPWLWILMVIMNIGIAGFVLIRGLPF